MDEERKIKFEFTEEVITEEENDVVLKIFGVGGCGCNIVNDMYETELKDSDIELVAVNTDKKALNKINAKEKLQIGKALTKGSGSGNNPQIGAKAAEEDAELIGSKIKGTDILILTAGLGGGTGSGASPVIADIAKDLETIIIGVLITPFEDEMSDKKRKIVNEALAKLKEKVNAWVLISNEKLNEVFDPTAPIEEGYRAINRNIIEQIKGVIRMIIETGEQNLDFADIRSILKQEGNKFIGIGRGSGADRGKKALENAINNPFLENVDFKGATDIIVNFVGNITLLDRKEVIQNIKKLTGENTSVKWGMVKDDKLGDEIEITILIAGIRDKAAIEETEEEIKKVENIQAHIIENDYESPILEMPTFQRLRFIATEKTKN